MLSEVDSSNPSYISGYYSWRNNAEGSWFIRVLCAVFDRYGSTLELLQLMTRVNYHVAQFLSSTAAPEFSNKKQIPDIATRLTKEVYFTPNQQTERQDDEMDETEDPNQLPHGPIVLDQQWSWIVPWWRHTNKLAVSLAFSEGNPLVFSGFPHHAHIGPVMRSFEVLCVVSINKQGVRVTLLYCYYSDVIMGAIASQITSLTTVYSTVYSDADQRKY